MLPEDVRAAHEQLSDVSLRFVEYAIREPGCACKLSRQSVALPEWRDSYAYEIQSWPTFVGPEKLRQIEQAAVGLAGLVRQIPTRFLGGDPKRVRDFYGLASELQAAVILQPPDGIAECLGRLDFIDGPGGLKCLELNMGSNLGGWSTRYLEPLLRRHPPVARFLAQEGIVPGFRDPLQACLSHVARDTMSKLGLWERRLSIGMATPPSTPFPPMAVAGLTAIYRSVLEEIGGGWTGDVVACTYHGGLSVRQGKLYAGDTRIHALLEYTPEATPRDVYRCFKERSITLYNGPLTRMFCDKRNLVFLSRLEDSDELSAEERSLVRDHVPWSRDVEPGETELRGEVVSLLDHLLAHRGDFVIKPAGGLGGKDVCVGRFAPQDDWERCVRAAAAGKGWLVQEYVPHHPFLYQHGESYLPHDLIWGLFCFGSSYGGAFLRMMPRDRGSGVVNSAQGASEGFVFEV